MLVDRSAELLGAHWDDEKANGLNIEIQNVQRYSNSKKIVCIYKISVNWPKDNCLFMPK